MLPARTGRQQVLHLLQRIVPPTGRQRAGRHRTLSDLLRARRSARSSGAAACSSSPTSSARRAGRRRSASSRMRHDVTAMRLSIRSSRTLPDFGLVTMSDAETGEQLIVDTHDPGFRARLCRSGAARGRRCATPGRRRRRHAGALHRRRPARRRSCASPTCASSAASSPTERPRMRRRRTCPHRPDCIAHDATCDPA